MTLKVRTMAASAKLESENVKDPRRLMRDRISSSDAAPSASISAMRQARLNTASICLNWRANRDRVATTLCSSGELLSPRPCVPLGCSLFEGSIARTSPDCRRILHSSEIVSYVKTGHCDAPTIPYLVPFQRRFVRVSRVLVPALPTSLRGRDNNCLFKLCHGHGRTVRIYRFLGRGGTCP